ncbi:hypothetical protein BJ085DRAFT_35823 [Dimargaris cristalligena]|uniref:SHSP domain-containing protein n=1 Tax=Dimargaris cristalligena TaxID=215637 RepID=A0A4P9ZX18_9FUNG|nr:hypothetical protein BJ085DRAFT_35823 [Dimargaris cristalligena]|eukprot:RKP38177.1 hypothetical protein BJ085DRAFT_35823 [Dimargaris cristalligena]
MSGFFTDRFYQNTFFRETHQHSYPGANLTQPEYQGTTQRAVGFGGTSTEVTTSPASHSGSYLAQFNSQFDSNRHHFVPVTVTDNYAEYSRSSDRAILPAEHSPLEEVNSDTQYKEDGIYLTMHWPTTQPKRVVHQAGTNEVQLVATGEERSKMKQVVIREQVEQDLLHRSFKVPDGYDTSKMRVEYNAGVLKAHIPKKRNQMLSMFYS